MGYIVKRTNRADRRVRYLTTPKAGPSLGAKWALDKKHAYEFETEHEAGLACQLHGGSVVPKEE